MFVGGRDIIVEGLRMPGSGGALEGSRDSTEEKVVSNCNIGREGLGNSADGSPDKEVNGAELRAVAVAHEDIALNCAAVTL